MKLLIAFSLVAAALAAPFFFASSEEGDKFTNQNITDHFDDFFNHFEEMFAALLQGQHPRYLFVLAKT